jgi:hypothetical protein
VAHDIGSVAVDNVGERRPRSRINVVHSYKHKSCRTAVGLTRPSATHTNLQSQSATIRWRWPGQDAMGVDGRSKHVS